MGAAMFCLARMSSAVLYYVVSRFLARLFERKDHPYNRKTCRYHCSKQTVFPRSTVRKLVNKATHTKLRSKSIPGLQTRGSDSSEVLVESTLMSAAEVSYRRRPTEDVSYVM